MTQAAVPHGLAGGGHERVTERLQDRGAGAKSFAPLASSVQPARFSRAQIEQRRVVTAAVTIRRLGVIVVALAAVTIGVLVFLPFFMPPEAWRDGTPTPAWDAYALGVTAAIALAGSPDMPTDLPSLRQAKLSGVFERRLTKAIGDDGMREWIERMTASEPEKRLEAVEAAREWNA